MGIFRTVAGMFNDDILIQETIKSMEDGYHEAHRQHPEMEPHDLLALVWRCKMALLGHKLNDPEMEAHAYNQTMQFACVPPPSCVRALALYMIYKMKEKAIESSPRYQQEYGMLMNPVFKAVSNGSLQELYAKYNPLHAKEMPPDRGSTSVYF